MMSCPGSPRTRMRPIGPRAPMRFLGSPRSTLCGGASDKSGRCPSRVWMTRRPSCRAAASTSRHGATAACSRVTSLPSAAPNPPGSRKSRCMSMMTNAAPSSSTVSGAGSASKVTRGIPISCLALSGNLQDRGQRLSATSAAAKARQLPNKCAASSQDAHRSLNRRPNARTSAQNSRVLACGNDAAGDGTRLAEPRAAHPWESFMKRREFLKSMTALTAASAVAAPAVWSPAKAQSRAETLLIVSESGPNNLDIQGVGTNVPGYEVSWNCYDRLISHEMKTVDGKPYYDKNKFKMELADDMKIDDMSVTFKLKKNATFQDGTPVTAKDVKWSLDRAVSVKGFPTFQMAAGSLTKPEQFVVVDDNTFRVDFARKDRLTVPDLAVIVPCVVNSELVKKHATEQDPWGLEYTKQNTAGSGAYKVASWVAGTEVVLERNDAWVGGPLPKTKKIIWRMVPSAGNRRALLERGDADISYDLPNKDFVELKQDGKLNIISTPYSNGIQYIGMNVKNPPFDNLKVRQAAAYAIPYQKIMDAVLFGLGKPLFGAPE